MADHEQLDWLNLPSDLLELIGQRSRDAVTGLAAFRSVCRTWRAAVGPAPRLLLPRAGSDSEHALVFPLSRGWSIVVDARDMSCHLSHLPTGATAALPKLNAVSDGSDITHRAYLHYTDEESARGSRWGPQDKIKISCPGYWPFTIRIGCPDYWTFRTYLNFTDYMRFAVHVAPGTPAAAGMIIMMHHVLLGETGMVFCRPGDAAWTKVEKPRPVGYGFFDFAYHDGKMFGFETNGVMAVFDAATLDVLHLVKPPSANKISCYCCCAKQDEFHYVHPVALPSKLVLVRISVKSSRPVAFNVFELGSAPDGLAWLKVTDAGNYELFLDGYHTTYRENSTKSGTLIYYVHDVRRVSTTAAYCYSMQDNKLECVYRSPDDSPECSTKPSWFVP